MRAPAKVDKSPMAAESLSSCYTPRCAQRLQHGAKSQSDPTTSEHTLQACTPVRFLRRHRWKAADEYSGLVRQEGVAQAEGAGVNGL